MRTRLFARTLAVLSVVAASCQSDMPSIKKSGMLSLALLLAAGLLVANGTRPILALKDQIWAVRR